MHDHREFPGDGNPRLAHAGALGDPDAPSLVLRSNQAYEVFMSVSVGNGLGSATADPFIQIDPSFLADHPGYSLQFSPGIDNEPLATPLPAALPLFGTALAALSGVGWIKGRRKVSA